MSVVRSVWFMNPFMVFSLRFGPGHFIVTTLGLDLYSETYLNNLLFLWCSVVENNLI